MTYGDKFSVLFRSFVLDGIKERWCRNLSEPEKMESLPARHAKTKVHRTELSHAPEAPLVVPRPLLGARERHERRLAFFAQIRVDGGGLGQNKIAILQSRDFPGAVDLSKLLRLRLAGARHDGFPFVLETQLLQQPNVAERPDLIGLPANYGAVSECRTDGRTDEALTHNMRATSLFSFQCVNTHVPSYPRE